MVIFHSYVSSLEGIPVFSACQMVNFGYIPHLETMLRTKMAVSNGQRLFTPHGSMVAGFIHILKCVITVHDSMMLF